MESHMSVALLPSPEVTSHQVAETDLPDSIHLLTADHAGEVLSPGNPSHSMDIVEEWGMQSFPASDPPANW